MAQAMERLLATPKTIPVFPCSNGMRVPLQEADHSKRLSKRMAATDSAPFPLNPEEARTDEICDYGIERWYGLLMRKTALLLTLATSSLFGAEVRVDHPLAPVQGRVSPARP